MKMDANIGKCKMMRTRMTYWNTKDGKIHQAKDGCKYWKIQVFIWFGLEDTR